MRVSAFYFTIALSNLIKCYYVLISLDHCALNPGI